MLSYGARNQLRRSYAFNIPIDETDEASKSPAPFFDHNLVPQGHSAPRNGEGAGNLGRQEGLPRPARKSLQRSYAFHVPLDKTEEITKNLVHPHLMPIDCPDFLGAKDARNKEWPDGFTRRASPTICLPTKKLLDEEYSSHVTQGEEKGSLAKRPRLDGFQFRRMPKPKERSPSKCVPRGFYDPIPLNAPVGMSRGAVVIQHGKYKGGPKTNMQRLHKDRLGIQKLAYDNREQYPKNWVALLIFKVHNPGPRWRQIMPKKASTKKRTSKSNPPSSSITRGSTSSKLRFPSHPT